MHDDIQNQASSLPKTISESAARGDYDCCFVRNLAATEMATPMTCDHLNYDDYFEHCDDCDLSGEQIHAAECGGAGYEIEEDRCNRCGIGIESLQRPR